MSVGTPGIARARLLRNHHRHEEAVAMLLSHLAQHPDDPDAFIELALNRSAIPGQEKQALADARTASGLAPERAFPLSLQARILTTLKKIPEAKILAQEALAIDPEQPYYWNTLGIVLCELERWGEVERAARKALALDPDEATASNLLSLALRRRNLLYASEEESLRRLQQDPESAFPFFNLGQAALKKKDFAEAEAHFLEALRLNPEILNGRNLLKEASQSRPRAFRWFLTWINTWGQVFVGRPLVGCMVIMCSIPLFMALAEASPGVRVGVSTLVYVTFFGPWLKRPARDLMLLKSAHAHLLVDPAEKKEAMMVAAGVFVGGILVTIAAFTGSALVATFAGGLWISSVHAVGIFTNPSKWSRSISAGLAVAFLVLAAYISWALVRNPDKGFGSDDAAIGVLAVCLIMIAVLLLRNPYGRLTFFGRG